MIHNLYYDVTMDISMGTSYIPEYYVNRFTV
jgi:hypothetical protein